ncbi:MAG: Uncharacterised protein [Cryomorphaceae bacterium]|nr:MAG: Uncharacterised protein [Cryomorphaceae bacterium]
MGLLKATNERVLYFYNLDTNQYDIPAQVNSEFVNVRWFLRININENLKKGCQTNG